MVSVALVRLSLQCSVLVAVLKTRWENLEKSCRKGPRPGKCALERPNLKEASV